MNGVLTTVFWSGFSLKKSHIFKTLCWNTNAKPEISEFQSRFWGEDNCFQDWIVSKTLVFDRPGLSFKSCLIWLIEKNTLSETSTHLQPDIYECSGIFLMQFGTQEWFSKLILAYRHTDTVSSSHWVIHLDYLDHVEPGNTVICHWSRKTRRFQHSQSCIRIRINTNPSGMIDFPLESVDIQDGECTDHLVLTHRCKYVH